MVTIDYNCSCDDGFQTQTLADMRTTLLVMMGYASQLAVIPAGIAALYNTHLKLAQELLYRRYSVFRTERFFTWQMQANVRSYDLLANIDTCTVKVDPRRITWVGISQGDGNWRPLFVGIDPMNYTQQGASIPQRFEIRQCIEVFPAPSDSTWLLRVKGHFGLLPFVDDADVTTIDANAILMHALANLKAHDGAPDARNYEAQLVTYIGDLVAGNSPTRRFFPGQRQQANAVPPRSVQ